jgi:hypothetical protein
MAVGCEGGAGCRRRIYEPISTNPVLMERSRPGKVTRGGADTVEQVL